MPSLNKAPEEGLKASALSGGENGLYTEGSICGVPVFDVGGHRGTFGNRTGASQKASSTGQGTKDDFRATDHHFKEDDLVWMYNPKRQRGPSPKLQQNWEGSYTIVKNDVVHRVQRYLNSKPKVIQINRLAPYQGSGHNSS
ncbi:hypothetical protein AVEN_96177-1 [Araneus ventricosus]|uniref:Uncharacterized protein n=1 Tax=Araneus ventricosus TaxID=182803 RepID=A0A4Y2FPV6_ARAVE|nr:hypothetical protein AVEN_96177-1 [Araneus ventricosus]